MLSGFGIQDPEGVPDRLPVEEPDRLAVAVPDRLADGIPDGLARVFIVVVVVPVCVLCAVCAAGVVLCVASWVAHTSNKECMPGDDKSVWRVWLRCVV